jgi:tyrosine-protein phosphatase YwqE
VFSFFKASPKKKHPPLITDVHSHLLPELDDGVRSLEESEEVILRFLELGYTKCITTPHIMSDFYRNDPSQIREKLMLLRNHLQKKNIAFTVEAAAEYYLDETLQEKITGGEELLTFGSKFLLFETNFITEPFQLKDFIFNITTQNYKPVLAHPERYHYMTMEKAEDLKDRGVLFQVNIPSIVGYYSKPIQNLAFKFIDKGWVNFLGSDCHNMLYTKVLEEAQGHRYFRKALDLPLLNYSL